MDAINIKEGNSGKMKRITNEMKLRLPAIGVNEAVARSVISAFVAELNPTVEELGDLRLAVSEAVTNCIVHAYRDLPTGTWGNVYISARLYDTREVTVEIELGYLVSALTLDVGNKADHDGRGVREGLDIKYL